MAQHGTPIWYELLTPDPDAAKRFYDAMTGWTVEARPAGPMDYRMITAEGGNVGGVMRLDEAMAAGGARPGWLMYVGVEDVDAAAAAIREAGGQVLRGPWDIPGVGRMAVATDPQGAPFYVMRGATEAAESDVFSPTAMGRVAWNELTTSDQPGALAFYTGVFGWTVAGAMPMGDMGDYTFLSLGDLTIGAAMTGRDRPTRWRFYHRVADLDASAANVARGGGQLMRGPETVPGGERVVIAADPHGGVFGMIGR